MYPCVLDKTLKGIRGVRLDNRKVLRAPGPRTKFFERFFICRSISCRQSFWSQTRREYGFVTFCLFNQPWVTQLNLLTNEKLDGLQTNKLESKRYHAGFGKRAAVVKFRNQCFTAKGIINDCALLTPDSY